MAEAFFLILAFVLGALFGYFVSKRSVGERRWRDGYVYGFNFAWDESSKLNEARAEQHLKNIRKKRPRLTLVKNNK